MICDYIISYILKGVHNVDFSGVRDDKCHTGVGESRVDSIFLYNLYLQNLDYEMALRLSHSR